MEGHSFPHGPEFVADDGEAHQEESTKQRLPRLATPEVADAVLAEILRSAKEAGDPDLIIGALSDRMKMPDADESAND